MDSEQLRYIKRFVERSVSGIMIIVCNDVELENISALLRLEIQTLQRVSLPADCQSFYEEIGHQVNLGDTAPLLISGLEKTIISSDYHPLLQNINLGRKYLADMRRLSILLVPEYLLPLIGRYAPDFRDWADVQNL